LAKGQPHEGSIFADILMAIVVKGATCSLGETVVDKLLSMDIDVVATEDSHRIRNQTLLEYSQVNLSDTGTGFSISFDGSSADIEIGKDIIVQDLIPSRNDKWMPAEIQSWLVGKDSVDNSRYWLSVIDAANAIAHIVKSESKISQLYMCGRREWLPQDSKAEFEMLWARTNQGISGKFTAETLFGHEIAGMDAKPIHENERQRPNLTPLHELLLELTGDGWRPLIPLRTAMMTMIAGLLE